MEIALNFLWVLLVLPAAWVYRRQAVPGAQQWSSTRLRPFLVLAAILVLLFPVVSATDDLHSVGFVLEEPGPHRWAKQLASGRLISISEPGMMLAQSFYLSSSRRNEPILGPVWLPPVWFVAGNTILELASRAPPASYLG